MPARSLGRRRHTLDVSPATVLCQVVRLAGEVILKGADTTLDRREIRSRLIGVIADVPDLARNLIKLATVFGEESRVSQQMAGRLSKFQPNPEQQHQSKHDQHRHDVEPILSLVPR